MGEGDKGGWRAKVSTIGLFAPGAGSYAGEQFCPGDHDRDQAKAEDQTAGQPDQSIRHAGRAQAGRDGGQEDTPRSDKRAGQYSKSEHRPEIQVRFGDPHLLHAAGHLRRWEGVKLYRSYALAL